MPGSRFHGAPNSGRRLLVVYSAMLTAALMALLLTGATGTGSAVFEELDVQRLNLHEPDGALRVAESGEAAIEFMDLDGRVTYRLVPGVAPGT